jgi:hypothetical protein
MIRRALLGCIVAAGLTVTIDAGGWGVITLKNLPDFAEAGRPVPLTFTVKGHGVAPASGLRPSIDAVSGKERVSASAWAGAAPGEYQASVVFPRPGQWVLTIQAGYRVTLLPLEVVAAGARPATPMSPAARGRALFVAKGCVTCHVNHLDTSNTSVNLGPALLPQKYQPEFLARMLADPAALIPPRRESPVRMPNLHLDQTEIASLVAFINSGAVTAGR